MDLAADVAWSVKQLDASFQQARRELGTHHQQIRVAGRQVLIRFAGASLHDRLSVPFAHLVAHQVEAPELTISVWESKRSKAPAPPLPPVPKAALDNPTHDHRLLLQDPSLHAVYHPAIGLLSAYSPGSGRAWMWAEDARRLPLGEEAAPYRIIWRWWGAESGHTLVHAGAVARPHGGGLLVGRGGSGKSTVSIACLAAGFDFAGDDYVMLDGSGAVVHGLYSTGKLELSHARRFTGEPPAATEERPSGQPSRTAVTKGAFYLPELFAGRVVDRLAVDAIIAPRLRLDRPESTIAPMAASQVLSALAVSSLIQLPGSKASDMEAMARLARRVPGFQLELGADVRQIPEVVGSLLQEVGGGS